MKPVHKPVPILLFYMMIFLFISCSEEEKDPVPEDDSYEHLFPVKNGSRYGFIDENGKIRIDFKYDDAEAFSEGLAAVSTGEKNTGGWSLNGYINKNEEWVIPEKFAMAGKFNRGIAVVSPGVVYNNKLILFEGLIDTTGKWVVEPTYGMIVPGEGYYRAIDTAGFEEATGRLVLEEFDWLYNAFGKKLADVRFKYSKPSPFPFLVAENEEGYANAFHLLDDVPGSKDYGKISEFSERFAVAEDLETGKKCLINSKMQEAFEPSFDDIRDVKEGVAEARKDGLWGYIDTLGNWIIEPKYFGTTPFHKGVAGVMLREGSELINKKGEAIGDQEFERIAAFRDGLAPAYVGYDCGLINVKGEFVVEPKYEEIVQFPNGLCMALRERKWGLLNLQSELVFPIKYDFIYDQDHTAQIFSMVKEDKKGLVNSNGDWLMPMSPESDITISTGKFSFNRLKLSLWAGGKKKNGYVDRKGNLAVPMDFDEAEDFELGLARVEKEGKMAYIDTTGAVIWNEEGFLK